MSQIFTVPQAELPDLYCAHRLEVFESCMSTNGKLITQVRSVTNITCSRQ